MANMQSACSALHLNCRALKSKGLQRVLPKGGQWGFFGWHTVRSRHKSIIITEGAHKHKNTEFLVCIIRPNSGVSPICLDHTSLTSPSMRIASMSFCASRGN